MEETMKWRSMEDAPTDGQVVDLDISGRMVRGCRWDEEAWGWVDAKTGNYVRGEDEEILRWALPFTPVE